MRLGFTAHLYLFTLQMIFSRWRIVGVVCLLRMLCWRRRSLLSQQSRFPSIWVEIRIYRFISFQEQLLYHFKVLMRASTLYSQDIVSMEQVESNRIHNSACPEVHYPIEKCQHVHDTPHLLSSECVTVAMEVKASIFFISGCTTVSRTFIIDRRGFGSSVY